MILTKPMQKTRGGARRLKTVQQDLQTFGTVGAGMAFKLSNKVNLAIEDRITIVKDDLLDGQRWQGTCLGVMRY